MAITAPRATLAAALLVAAHGLAASQGPPPDLSKDQRATLLSLVEAVKASDAAPAADDDWPVHLFRTSDGAHYVAFTAPMPAGLDPAVPLALYVRLAPRPAAAAPAALRSAVEDWLTDQQQPLPMQARRLVQVPSGEMPVGGPMTMSNPGDSQRRARDAEVGQASAALLLLEREARRAREAEEAREQERRAALEAAAVPRPDLFPFEDFDMNARLVPAPGGAAVARAVAAGAGAYDLSIGWAALDPTGRATRTGVIRRVLDLPDTDRSTFGFGSIVLADDIRTRTEVLRPDQQTAHPYVIGPTEIVPAPDHVLGSDERLAAAFQIVNALPAISGKPDVAVDLQLFRVTPAGERPAGSLSPLAYNASTLPADFDITRGHPIIAAMTAPLGALTRGDYRLAITATDRVARATAVGEVRFSVTATPAALLAQAPAFAPPFRRDLVLAPARLEALLALIEGGSAAPATAGLAADLREQRFVQVVANTASSPAGDAAAELARSLGLYGVGDNPRAVMLQVSRALEHGADAAAAQFLMGACFALDDRDAEAVDAWQAALKAGLPAGVVAVPLAETLARLGRAEEAGRVAADRLAAGERDEDLVRLAAAADIAAGREADALDRLGPLLGAAEVDGESQWLALHALFASYVRGDGPGATTDGRRQFEAIAAAYLEAGGRWETLATEWRTLIAASSPVP